jgi:hypothetical protein
MTMSASATSVASISELLKNVYEDALHSDLNNEFIPYKRLEDKSKDIAYTGKAWIWDITYGRSGAVRAASDGGAVPKAARYNYKQASATPSVQVGAHQWTDMALKVANNNKGAFANVLTEEMEKLKNDLVHSLARQMFGTGDSIITTLRAASDFSAASGYLNVEDVAMFEIGMRLDVMSSAYATRITAGDCAVVAFVDVDNKRLLVTSGSGTTLTIASTSTTDIVIVYESYDATNGVSLEMTGLQQIINDTGTLHGLDLATYPWWRAQVMGNGGVAAPLTATRIDSILQRMMGVGSYPTIGFCSWGVYNALTNLLRDRQRYNDTKTIDGGLEVKVWTGPQGPVPIMADRWCPKGKLILPNEKELAKLNLGKPEFIEGDKAKLHFAVSYLKYDSVLVHYCQMITTLRTKHGMLKDIIEE